MSAEKFGCTRLRPKDGRFMFLIRNKSNKFSAYIHETNKERDSLMELAAEFFPGCIVSADIVVSEEREKFSDHLRLYQTHLVINSKGLDSEEFEDMVNDFAHALRIRAVDF